MNAERKRRAGPRTKMVLAIRNSIQNLPSKVRSFHNLSKLTLETIAVWRNRLVRKSTDALQLLSARFFAVKTAVSSRSKSLTERPSAKPADDIALSANDFADKTSENHAEPIAITIQPDDIKIDQCLGVKEAKQMIDDFANKVLSAHGIDGKFYCRITTEESQAESRRKKDALQIRDDGNRKEIMAINNPEIRKRLAVLDSNSQSVYHYLHHDAKDGISTSNAHQIAMGIGISKRSAESGIYTLKMSGLIKSIGTRKNPKLELQDIPPADSPAECILVVKSAANEKVRFICSVCTLDCPRKIDAPTARGINNNPPSV